MSKKQVKVWDPLVRIFHWSLVLFFVIAYLTGEDESQLHIYTGYVVLGLVVWRILWGFIGTQYARFSQFVYRPKTVMAYLHSLLAAQPAHYLGHNPAGGYMIIALLFMLLVTTLTGLKVYGVEGYGPLATSTYDPPVTLISSAQADDDDHNATKEHKVDEALEEFWEEIHEFASNLTVLLIIIHILGVTVSSRIDRENLVKAMVTGKKQVDE